MVITTLIFYVVAAKRWGWNRYVVLVLCGLVLVVDLAVESDCWRPTGPI